MKNVISPLSQGPWPPKLDMVLTQDEGTPPKKSRDTSILTSHDNSKTSYFLNHRVYAPPILAGYYYGRGLRRRKLGNLIISLFPSFAKKKYISNVKKSSRRNVKLLLAKNKHKCQLELRMLR